GGRTVRARTEPHVPAVVPTASPESEKEQRRLAVLLLDQLVALHQQSMARGDFVTSVVPLSEKEASSVLEQRIDAGIDQGTVFGKLTGRARAKAKQMLAPNMQSPLVAETVFHLVRVLRRIDTVTSRDTRRIPRSPLQLRGLDARQRRAGRLGQRGAFRRAPLTRRGRQPRIEHQARDRAWRDAR